MVVTRTCHAPCHQPDESSAIISIYRYQLTFLVFIVQSDLLFYLWLPCQWRQTFGFSVNTGDKQRSYYSHGREEKHWHIL